MIDLARFVVFKPVPGGYVYRPPTPWLFGSRAHHLVTDEQKAALLALYSASTRPVVRTIRISSAALTAVLGTALSLWARHSGYDVPGLFSLIVMVAMIASIYLASAAGRGVLVQRLRPILATLPPTNERITASEERQAMIEAAAARQPATLSPVRRRIARIGILISMFATLGAMISRANDVYGADHLNFVTLYLANANLSGAISTTLIFSMGFLFFVFGRNSPRA
jgi:hypothetical protein